MMKEPSNVRIGPISLLTLISVLLLAVLAVLCVTSANAANAMSQRQADAVSETYSLDASGQNVLAAIDEQLHELSASSGPVATSAVDARLQGKLDLLATNDQVISLQTDGSRIKFTVSAPSGKALSAAVRISDSLTYNVEEWKTTTTQSEPEQTLWSGESTNR